MWNGWKANRYDEGSSSWACVEGIFEHAQRAVSRWWTRCPEKVTIGIQQAEIHCRCDADRIQDPYLPVRRRSDPSELADQNQERPVEMTAAQRSIGELVNGHRNTLPSKTAPAGPTTGTAGQGREGGSADRRSMCERRLLAGRAPAARSCSSRLSSMACRRWPGKRR